MNIFKLLGVLFIGLKLTDHIDWSWFWVVSPFWLWFVCITFTAYQEVIKEKGR